jgi:iron complex transport system ATP-binding protein
LEFGTLSRTDGGAIAEETSSTITPTLELRNVHLQRDGNTIIGNISFRLEDSQSWVILGANGSGKTTLLKIMGLYEHPSSGTVRVLGDRLGDTDVRELRRRIGFLSAALADQFRPTLSAHDVVRTGRYAALEPWWHEYSSEDNDRANWCLAQYTVAQVASRAFGSLSSGEQQRVLLARTLMNDPAVVLLDEPTARLDLGGREELVAALAAVARDDLAAPIVMVTHHVDEIPPGTTHALLLRAGDVLSSGSIDTTLTSDGLSECFGMKLRLERRQNGRFSAWAQN